MARYAHATNVSIEGKPQCPRGDLVAATLGGPSEGAAPAGR